MGGSDFAALLAGRANIERRLDMALGAVDDFEDDDIDLIEDAEIFGGDDA